MADHISSSAAFVKASLNMFVTKVLANVYMEIPSSEEKVKVWFVDHRLSEFPWECVLSEQYKIRYHRLKMEGDTYQYGLKSVSLSDAFSACRTEKDQAFVCQLQEILADLATQCGFEMKQGIFEGLDGMTVWHALYFEKL